MPKRIQRKRTKGWHMPSNTVYVGRPSKYGNPYKITSFSLKIKGMDSENAVRLYEQWLRQKLIEDTHFLDELKGKDLACWCPLEDKNGNPVPCHADVILKILEEQYNA